MVDAIVLTGDAMTYCANQPVQRPYKVGGGGGSNVFVRFLDDVV